MGPAKLNFSTRARMYPLSSDREKNAFVVPRHTERNARCTSRRASTRTRAKCQNIVRAAVDLSEQRVSQHVELGGKVKNSIARKTESLDNENEICVASFLCVLW